MNGIKLLRGVADHLDRMTTPEEEYLQIPRDIGHIAGPARLVDDGARASELVVGLQQRRVAWLGLDTEFGYGVEDDITTIEPSVVSIAAVVRRENDLQILPGVVFDLRIPNVVGALKRLFRMPWRFVSHGARAEILSLKNVGLPVPRDIWCTLLAAQLCSLGEIDWRDFMRPVAEEDDLEEVRARMEAEDARVRKLSLVNLCWKYGTDHQMAAVKKEMQQRFMNLRPGDTLTPQMLEYSAEDAVAVARLYPHLRQELDTRGLTRHFETIELPALPTLVDMEASGISVDTKKLEKIRAATDTALQHYSSKLQRIAARAGMLDFNLDSHPQRLALLRNLGVADHFRKRNGKYSFNKQALKQFRGVHPVVDLLFRYAWLRRIPGDKLFTGELIRSDGRIHARIKPLGAATGRPSFAAPNLGGVDRRFRPAFVPDTVGDAIGEVDFTAQEPGIAGAHYEDHRLVEEWNGPRDVYLSVARGLRTVLKISGDMVEEPDEVLRANCPRVRPRMKVLFLATMYGMIIETIAVVLRCSKQEARNLQRAFFDRFLDLEKNMAAAEELGLRRGYAEAVTGMKRFLKVKARSAKHRRQVRNFPVQGGGACVLKLLLPRVQRYLNSVGGRVLVPLFDAVIFQVPQDRLDEATHMVSFIMKEAFRELYPDLDPKVDANISAPWCWNKGGKADAIERFEEDPTYEI